MKNYSFRKIILNRKIEVKNREIFLSSYNILRKKGWEYIFSKYPYLRFVTKKEEEKFKSMNDNDEKILIYTYIKNKIEAIKNKYKITTEFTITYYSFFYNENSIECEYVFTEKSNRFSIKPIKVKDETGKDVYKYFMNVYSMMIGKNGSIYEFFDSELFENIILHEIGHLLSMQFKEKPYIISKFVNKKNKFRKNLILYKGIQNEIVADTHIKRLKPTYKNLFLFTYITDYFKSFMDTLYPRLKYIKKV